MIKLVNRLLAAFLIGGIRVYQATLSPLFGNCCRFTPSCSHYGVEAIRVHGPFYGTWLTIRRLLRCRPWGPSGYDPVPPPRPRHSHQAPHETTPE